MTPQYSVSPRAFVPPALAPLPPLDPAKVAEAYRLAKLATVGREAEFEAMDRRDRAGPHYRWR